MGTRGAGLYKDDAAADLRDTIGLLCKVPGEGDRLLELLAQLAPEPAAGDEDESTYWFVVADQFARRGLRCERATERALALIASGADLAQCRERGADDRFLSERAKVLDTLATTLRASPPPKATKAAGKPPAMVLAAGEIHAFPAMKGFAQSPYRLPTAAPFVADGWGALAVLATGRLFDWLPWVALASLGVDARRRPQLVDALDARLIVHGQTRGAGRFVPRSAHARVMGLELLGRVELDGLRVATTLSRLPVADAIRHDWSICYAGFSVDAPIAEATSSAAQPRFGVALSTLLSAPTLA